MSTTLEIFSQGEEVVRGQIADTNAAWLSEQTAQLGFTITRHTAVGDKLDDLITLLREIAQRADCCLCTGGLGPTSDDLTAEAVAKAFDLPLIFDETAFVHIKQFFVHRNKPMPESNKKQALLPIGAIRLDNSTGTAPGFALKYQRCWFVFMPGVPSEMRYMYLEKVSPLLQQHFVVHPRRLITLRTLGLGESAIQDAIKHLKLPKNVELGFRAVEDVQVKLLFPEGCSERVLRNIVDDMAKCLGDYVFAIEGLGHEAGDLIATIDGLMQQSQHSLAIVETASQGMLVAKCSGAQWLVNAHYAQSVLQLKQYFSIADHINDIYLVAKRIAVQIQQRYAVDFALVQLYADDKAILSDKNRPVTVHTVLLAGNKYHYGVQTIAGALQRKQNYSALMSLDVLRRSF